MDKIIPSSPYTDARVISAKVAPDFHRQIRELAAQKDCLVSHVIKAALVDYLKSNQSNCLS